MSRREILRALVDAASRVARDGSLVAPIAKSTGLSGENVQLGLEHHLETRATDAEIDALCAATTEASHVHVILSANVFVAPLRAIAIALAASDHVTVRPSRREPHFTRALVDALADARVTLAPDADPRAIRRGEIHVYGRDETIRDVRAAARSDVVVRGHGAGLGIALVMADLARAARALVADIVPFDQRGCLSPRVVFVSGDAHGFAKYLFDALEARAREVPRGNLGSDELAEAAAWAATLEFAGTLHRGASCAVGVLDTLALPPTGRHVLVVPLASPDPLRFLLGKIGHFVTAVGSDDLEIARVLAPRHARISALGAMQRPPLDGPVDLR